MIAIIAMMSDKEVEIRRQYASRLKHPQTQSHSKRPTLPTENPELTIKLRESTIKELKTLSWEVCKTGNERTYDDIILFLLKSYSDEKI